MVKSGTHKDKKYNWFSVYNFIQYIRWCITVNKIEPNIATKKNFLYLSWIILNNNLNSVQYVTLNNGYNDMRYSWQNWTQFNKEYPNDGQYKTPNKLKIKF